MLDILLFLLLFLFTSFVLAGTLFTLFKRRIAYTERTIRFLADNNRIREESNKGSTEKEEKKPWFFQNVWEKGIEKLNNKVSKTEKKKLDTMLKEAGYPFKSAVDFRLFQLIMGVSGVLIIMLVAFPLVEDKTMTWILAIAVGLLGFRYPVFYLGKKKTERVKEINKDMPDFFDTVNLLLEAGMGLDAAIAQVCENNKCALSKEFIRTLEDMKLGKSRREAFYDLRKRIPSDSFQSIITALIQADQLGIGMAKVLGSLTIRIREQRREAAREQAMKAPVKMLFPMVFFIFPSLFIVILGPMAVTLVTKGLGG